MAEEAVAEEAMAAEEAEEAEEAGERMGCAEALKKQMRWSCPRKRVSRRLKLCLVKSSFEDVAAFARKLARKLAARHK